MIQIKNVTLLFLTLALTACNTVEINKYSAKNVFKDPAVAQLAKATANGDIEKIDSLIALGVDIDASGKDNLTPAYWSFMYVSPSSESKEGFKHLIKKGANTMQIHEPSKHPLLHMTARGDDSAFLEIILEHSTNYDLNAQIIDETWSTPMLTAMLARRFENFEMLIKAGADIEKKNTYNEKPITLMTKPGTWGYALYLLEQGADYNVGNEKIERNPEGRPEIVRSLENMNYWEHLYPDPSGEPSDREKVITFLQDRNVEVYPYHREDDPRYNPRPLPPADIIATNKKWNTCNWNYEHKDQYFKTRALSDVNLYKDISPDNYSRESQNIYGLAMINLNGLHSGGVTGIIEAEFFGRDQEVYSTYIFEERQGKKLECVIKIQNIYSEFNTQPNSKIKKTIEYKYVINNDSCYRKEGLNPFEKIKNQECNNFRTDAQTYKKMVNDYSL